MDGCRDLVAVLIGIGRVVARVGGRQQAVFAGRARGIGVHPGEHITFAGAGLALFGTGVHGLTQIDGRLATATERQQVRDVNVRHDCPAHQRPQLQRL